MCGRVIQTSGPLSLAIVDGLDVSDSRFRPRYNAAPGQELLVIRQNHKTDESGERSLDLIRWGNTLRVRIDLLDNGTKFEPGMTVWLNR
jgi:putative SOS response-associated peptidase YedK